MKTEKELKEVYGNISNQGRELFIKQFHHFRNIMCSSAFSIERKNKEFENLCSKRSLSFQKNLFMKFQKNQK